MKRAGELLASFFDRQTLEAAQDYSELFSSWQSIAGDKLAAHSRIRELEHSVLSVEADHPGWIQILQTREKELLDALCRRFPDRHITGISFRLSRDPPPPPSTKPPQTDRDEDSGGSVQEPAPDDFDPATAGLYEKIGDEHFRETLKRLEESIKHKTETLP
jgi:predicted nucleic acid-binding Zn ribbon protein